MSKLLVVSNRLPVTVIENNGVIEITESSGGLVTGISSYLSTLRKKHSNDYLWIGWPGKMISKKARVNFADKAASLNLAPVYIPEKIMDKFYLGFCNRTIWPLFHYFPDFTVYDSEYWENFADVNRIFTDEIVKHAAPDDTIWIHDYHLMLLPNLVRERLPSARIGFFLHIPFPSYEVFRMLPKSWRTDILTGLLGADLIGFHTFDYTRYFLNCVQRLLGYENQFGQILMPERIVKVDTFPMGIDYEGFVKSAFSPEALDERAKLTSAFQRSKLILSIDRLDYTKGVLNRLEGYEAFLNENPAWHTKATLLMVVVPSRIGVDRYKQMKREIDEKVGSINGKFGTIDWTPIIYQYTNIDQKSLAGLYRTSDVALITPLRDGMNLIAKEYLTCRTDLSGVLILSEMAGAAKELGEAILINPNNTGEIAGAIKAALEMNIDEQKKRNVVMRTRLKRYDVFRWADHYLESLDKVILQQNQWSAKLLDDDDKPAVIEQFRYSARSLLFLDYDGTLVPFTSLPELASPTEDVLNVLKRLCMIPGVDVVIISGRDKDSLSKWFGKTKMTIAAEHGAWIKNGTGSWERKGNMNTEWKKLVHNFLENFSDMLPGSFVEEKDFSLVWHYRKSDPDQGSRKAKELLDDLVNITANIDVQVLRGAKIIEVRNNGVSKGNVAKELAAKNKYDFILAAGDDWTDEEMFSALPPEACTIRIGISSTHAKFNLQNCFELRKLLTELADVKNV